MDIIAQNRRNVNLKQRRQPLKQICSPQMQYLWRAVKHTI
ncbi:hypothetical protein CLOBOL_04158 [Enterocloster bolteae ATCC BAA-613]|uniref:Uncharacterized protein n=1 Tax=Enterocloster bolteae (strain ATCC BAA-613 / DSM 15670 / CCUG 46953 / JCM 12243 / WAL 16351) TaxID=411902 RepID=A8RUY5_ENTBW|nr:hypothetical protein CLOBOL_04158 [Enterocloster bolteae ATCC BAA-613]